jgi:hypothetical protein
VVCESKIREDLKEALKQHDGIRVSTLRLLLSKIKNAEIAEHCPLDDSKIIDVITKEVNQHRESIKAFKEGNRNDLTTQEEAELSILMEYLPEQMSRQEIMAAAQQVIRVVGAKGVSDKGKVMSQLMPQLKGRASGKETSDMVLELLTGL